MIDFSILTNHLTAPMLHAVYGLFIFECIQVGLATHDAYAVYGAGWGDVMALDSTHLLWLSIPVMSGMSALAISIFRAQLTNALQFPPQSKSFSPGGYTS